MALTYNELTAITRQYIRPKLVDNFFSSHVLWNKLLKASRVNRGLGAATNGTSEFDISIPIIHAQNPSGGSYEGDDLLLTATTQKWTAATFKNKYYYENMAIKETDRLRNGTEGAIKILTAESESARLSLQKRLAEAVYGDGTGNSSKDLDGLKTTTGAVGSGTYGNIAVTDVPTWRAGGASAGIDSSSTVTTLDLINGMDLQCTWNGQGPNLRVTTKTIYRAIWNLLQPQQRFVDQDLAKAGFQNITVNGVPVVFDDDCTASYLYVLNTNFFELYIHPDRDFATEPWQKPLNQDVSVSKLWFAGNLTCNSRRHQGCFTALTS